MTSSSRAEADERAGLLRRTIRRLCSSLPSAREILIGGPVWGLMMAMSSFLALYLRNGAQTYHICSILLLFFCGGIIAWPCALFLGRFGAIGRRGETRFAAFFLCLTVCTIAATAFLFAMDYRMFYSQWHEPFGTRIWMYQFVFTSAAAVYQFVVMGVPLFVPFGFAALALASLWLARQTPGRQH